MSRAKVILVDADVISHFIATGHIYDLNDILSPHYLLVVENVIGKLPITLGMPQEK